MNLYTVFKNNVDKFPKKIAVKMGVQQLTYDELDKRCEVVAQYLLEKGVQPHDLIGLALPRSVELIVSILAILRVGAAYVPLDTSNPRARLVLIIKDSQPKYIITCGEYKNIFSRHNSLYIEDVNYPKTKRDLPEVLENFPAYIIYTSGTTGQPKGVVIPHSNVLTLFNSSCVQGFEFNSKDRWSLFHSYAFDYSVWEIWGALLNGACLVVSPEKITKNISSLFEFIKQQKITVLSLTPGVFKQLVLEHANYQSKFKTLRYIVFGGERFDLNDLEAWYEYYQEHMPELVNMYGITETTIHCSIKILSKKDLVNKQISPIGKPLNHFDFVLLDDNKKQIHSKEIGEIYISGGALALGYFNQPELTKEKFLVLKDIGRESESVLWYKTNDLAWQDENGSFYYAGRCDSQVKYHGFRIELDEINAALMSHPKLLLASVLIHQLENKKDILIAFYHLKNYQEVSQDEISVHLKSKLPEYMLPSLWYEIKDIPLTQNGKVDNNQLIQSYINKNSEQDNFLDKNIILNDTEKKLSNIWITVLGINRVLTHSDNFFMLGGYSLLAGQVVARLKKQFQINISIKNILDYPTIAELAKYIDDNFDLLKVSEETVVKQMSGSSIPASVSQLSLYYLFQVNPGAQYNIPFLIYFDQKLDYKQLEKSLNMLVQQHESLRTSFVYDDSGVVQIINDNIAIDFPNVKASERNLIKKYQKKSSKIFNLDKAPLFFVEYIDFTDKAGSALFFNIHHIIFDGSSFNIFINSLLDNYKSLNQGIGNKINYFEQYRYFSTAENKKISSDKFKEDKQYWQKYLHCNYSKIEYPKPVKLQELPKINIVSKYVANAQVEIIKQFSREAGVTEFSVYLSAFYLCLYRHCRQSDMTVGVPLANRNQSEYENIIGFLVNTLPFRIKVDGKVNLGDFIQSVNGLSFEMLSRQDVPLSEIVKWLGRSSEKQVYGSPLFDTIFVLQNTMALSGKHHSINYESKSVYTNTAKFSLSVLCAKGENDNIECVFEYDSERLDSQFLDEFSSDFILIVHKIILNLNTQIKLFLGEFEKEKNIIISQSNKTSEVINATTIADLLNGTAKQHAKSNAITFNNLSLSYQLLAELSSRVAAKIIKILGYNHSQDKIIGLHMDRSAEMIIVLMGVIKSGYAYLPLYPDLPTARLQFIINDASPEIIISDKKHMSVLASDIVLYDDLLLINYDITSLSDVNTSPACLGYIMYTSGTTGWPKGIALSHQALLNRLCWMSSRYQLNIHDVSVMKTPFNFDVSFGEMFLPLVSGAGLFIADPEGHKDPRYLLAIMQKNNITHIHFVPSMLNIFIELLESGIDFNLPKLKVIFCSGEALLQSSVDKLLQLLPGIQVYNQYGPTESGEVSDYQVCAGESAEIVPIGKPIWNTRFYVLDENGNELPVGIPGELHIAGDCLATEYFNSPELTKENFIQDHNFSPSESVLYKTKDLVMWRADGNLLYLGRLDKQIKIRGLRIEPGEIENTLLEHESISQATVQLVKNPNIQNDPGSLAAFYVICDDGVSVNSDDLEKYLALTLPDYMVPQKFVQLAAMPVTANGKVDVTRLPAVDFDSQVPVGAELNHLPATKVEKKMARLWAECLGVKEEHIFMQSDFFALGGHSILLIRLILLVEKHFKKKIKINDFIVSPKLFSMCQIVYGEHEKNNAESLIEMFNQDKKLVDGIALSLDGENDDQDYVYDGNNEAVLLTGASGFLGMHLLQALLQKTVHQVVCLVRAETDELARARLLQRVKNFEFDFPDNFWNRIEVYAGDLNQVHFGLSEKDYVDLSQRVMGIYHSAAKVNHLYNYNQHRETNVVAIKKLIEFAVSVRRKKINFISTSAVSLLENGREQLSYNVLPVDAGGYVQSKWMGEFLLLQAKNKFNLSVNILRPGYIAANSQVGVVDYQQNHLSLLWMGFIYHGVAPGWSSGLELVPVDCLADIVVQLPERREGGSSFNLVNPWRINWQECISLIASSAKKQVKIISHDQWVSEYLSKIDKSSPWYSLVSLYDLKDEGENVVVADEVIPVSSQVMRDASELENIYPSIISKQLSYCLDRWKK